ncbi:MAG TPA: DUF6193 family natural product biosynthesis protein [Tepidisphaeraceae bacterium]|nr:DUF6193 family natural product biosynthesis protein [Tepidisphaeraceae bacterium]
MHGSLGKLLKAVVHELSSPLVIVGGEDQGLSKDWGLAKQNAREGRVSLDDTQGILIAEFREHGSRLAHLATRSPRDAVRALEAWVIEQVNTQRLSEISPGIAIESFTEFYEAGPEVFVRECWLRDIEYFSSDDHKRHLLPVALEAFKDPQLSRLLPVTSHGWLSFSRCTSYPFSTPGLWIGGHPDGRCRVRDQSPNERCVGDAKTVVAFVVQHLPQNFGPAIHGTADDFET